jgi:hypothetical protein
MQANSAMGTNGQAAGRMFTFSSIRASFLKDHDLIGNQDPYLEFVHGQQKVKTAVDKSAGKEASWTEAYTLEAPIGQGTAGQECKVYCYNKNFALPDGHLGAATFLLQSGRQNLVLYNKKNQETGSLSFEVSDGQSCTTGTCGMKAARGNVTDINATAGGGGVVCNQEFFTKIEDRPVTKEITTVITEHHPIEKQFVIETRPTGKEHELTDRAKTEVIDSQTRIVEEAKRNPCAGAPTVEAAMAH